MNASTSASSALSAAGVVRRPATSSPHHTTHRCPATRGEHGPQRAPLRMRAIAGPFLPMQCSQGTTE